MFKKIIIIFLWLYVPCAYGATIGSDSAVTRFNTQQTLATGDRVAGFAWLNAGFALTDSATTATWDTFFQTSGIFNFNGGSLLLNTDLIFYDVTTISRLGNIIGNGHELRLAPKMSQIQTTTTLSGCVNFTNVKLYLTCNVDLQNCCIKFSGSNLINGSGYNLSIKETCTIVVDSNSDLWFKNVTLKNINRNKLGAVDSTSTYLFSRATIVMDNDTTFTRGKFTVLNDLEIQGNGFSFAYQTDSASTVSVCGKLILDAGVTFSYAPSVASNALLQLSEGAKIIMNSARLHASTAGLKLTTGDLIVDGASFLSSDATSTANAIRLGDGVSAANNLCVHFLPAGTLQLLSGIVVYDNV